MMRVFMSFFFFFFNDTATTEIYPLSLHDALPISQARAVFRSGGGTARGAADRTALGARSALRPPRRGAIRGGPGVDARSEEHTSELQSQSNLVCRLLLEKKKTNHTHHTSEQSELH